MTYYSKFRAIRAAQLAANRNDQWAGRVCIVAGLVLAGVIALGWAAALGLTQ